MTYKYSSETHSVKHEGVKYHCNRCDYEATTQSSLKNHIQSIHEEDIKKENNSASTPTMECSVLMGDR